MTDVWSGLETDQNAQPTDVWKHLESGAATAPEAEAQPNKVPGLGTQLFHVGEDLIGGAVHQIGNLADIVTGTPPGKGSYAAGLSAPFQHPADYEQPELKQQMMAGKPRLTYDSVFSQPLADTLKERVPQALEGAATVAGAGNFLRPTGELEGAVEEGHPLTDVAKAEASKIEGPRAVAQESGVPLTPRQITPAQRFINNAANHDLDLPKNSPVTSDMIDAGIAKNVSPAWEDVRATPPYQVDQLPKYQAAIGKVDLEQIEPEYRPPTSGPVSGEQVADLSPQLRSIARGQFDDANNPNFTYAQRQAFRKSAQAHYQAAKALEGSYGENESLANAARDADGNITAPGETPKADAWQQARVYQAKAESWRSALDGAGNVIGAKIKKNLLSDEPMSADMEQAARVVASDQEMFKSSRISTPPEGATKKIFKTVAPMAGALAGSMLPFPGGPEIGAGVTQWLSNKIAK